MRLLDRYLLRELLAPLAFCLCGFLAFWISFDVFQKLQEFQKHDLHLLDVLHYYAVMAPAFLVMVLPVGLLFALLYALTNHARHNEITAIRAAGVSVFRLSLPYFAVGLLSSIAYLLMNEMWVPDVEESARRILTNDPKASSQLVVTNFGFINHRDKRTWLIPVYDARNKIMYKPQVGWAVSDGVSRQINARQAVWTNNVWLFLDVQDDTFVDRPVRSVTNRAISPMWVAVGFLETPEVLRSEIRIGQRIKYSAGVRQPEIPMVELIDYLRLHPTPPPKDRNWLHTHLQGRLAAPWVCLFVVLIALPFGVVASGRRNVFVGVASSIFICFGYFLMQVIGLQLASGGIVPPWLGAWAPNLAIGVTAIVLIRRAR